MRSTVIALFAGNFFGKLVGVVRELVLAALFGTTAPVAAVRIATTATLVPTNLFTADALSVGFLPTYARLGANNVRSAAVFFHTVSRLVMGLSLVVMAILIIFRDFWTSTLGPGLSADTDSLATSMVWIMAVSVPFYVWTNLATYLELAHGRHRMATARPVVQSVGLIAGTVTAFVTSQPLWLAIGFSAAYVALSAWGYLVIRRTGIVAWRQLRPTRPEIQSALRTFGAVLLPVIWLPIFSQSAWAAERAIASIGGDRVVASVDYARLISDTANVLIAAPLGLALLSKLGAMTTDDAADAVTSVSRRILIVCIPLSGAVALGSYLITSIIYSRGKFDVDSTLATAQILAGLAFGLFAQVLSYVQVKALNARGRNRSAAAVVAFGAAITVLTQFLLTPLIGPAGIGIGVSIGAMTQCLLASPLLGSARRDLLHFAQLLPLAITPAVVILVTPTMSITSSTIWAVGFLIASAIWIMTVRPLRRTILGLMRRN